MERSLPSTCKSCERFGTLYYNLAGIFDCNNIKLCQSCGLGNHYSCPDQGELYTGAKGYSKAHIKYLDAQFPNCMSTAVDPFKGSFHDGRCLLESWWLNVLEDIAEHFLRDFLFFWDVGFVVSLYWGDICPTNQEHTKKALMQWERASGICLHCGSGCGFSLLLISPFVFECLIWMPLMCPASVTNHWEVWVPQASWKVSIDCTC